MDGDRKGYGECPINIIHCKKKIERERGKTNNEMKGDTTIGKVIHPYF